MNAVRLDRDQLSTRLGQLQKVIVEADEGEVHRTRGSMNGTEWGLCNDNYTMSSTNNLSGF